MSYYEMQHEELVYTFDAAVDLDPASAKGLERKITPGWDTEVSLVLEEADVALGFIDWDWGRVQCDEVDTFLGAAERVTRMRFATEELDVTGVDVVHGRPCVTELFAGQSCDVVAVRFSRDQYGHPGVHTYSLRPNEDGTVVIEYIKEHYDGESDDEAVEFVVTKYDASPLDSALFTRFCDPTLVHPSDP